MKNRYQRSNPFPRGSLWRKWDLHVHAPGTKLNDYHENSDEGWKEFCQVLADSEVEAFGITDFPSRLTPSSVVRMQFVKELTRAKEAVPEHRAAPEREREKKTPSQLEPAPGRQQQVAKAEKKVRGRLETMEMVVQPVDPSVDSAVRVQVPAPTSFVGGYVRPSAYDLQMVDKSHQAPLLLSSGGREDINRIAAAHGARDVRVFGSVGRGESSDSSDLDLIVDMAAGRSLLDLVALEADLEEALGVVVDVVTEKSLSPYLRDRVLAEAVSL